MSGWKIAQVRLKQVAKCYVLEDYFFQRCSPSTLKGNLYRIAKFFNYLNGVSVDKLSDVNKYVYEEYVQNLRRHIKEKDLSRSSVICYFQAFNRLTKGCNFCEDKLSDSYYKSSKEINSLAKQFSDSSPQKTLTIPHSVARNIIKSATRTLDDELVKCVEVSKNIELVRRRYPNTWRGYICSHPKRKMLNISNTFAQYGTMRKFDNAIIQVRTALQIYILFYTGMRANELANLPSNCCSIDLEDNVCEVKSGIIKGKGPRRDNGLYVWYAPPQLMDYINSYLEVLQNIGLKAEFLCVNMHFKQIDQRAACTGNMGKKIISYCKEKELLTTREGDQWKLKLHQFRTHYVHFMTQNHMNFSAVSEQMKHKILDTTFGYSGSLEGSMTRTIDPLLMKELSKSKAAFDWKEAEKSLCCETATNAPEGSTLIHYRDKFKATIDPKERNKVIEEYLAVGHDPCRMSVGVCVANHNVRHKCGMQNNLLGCKSSCPNFTCEVHDYGRIVYEKAVEFRRLAGDLTLPSVKRALYGKFADQFDALMQQWENAECREPIT